MSAPTVVEVERGEAVSGASLVRLYLTLEDLRRLAQQVERTESSQTERLLAASLLARRILTEVAP